MGKRDTKPRMDRQYETFVKIPEGLDPEVVAEKAREYGMATPAVRIVVQADVRLVFSFDN